MSGGGTLIANTWYNITITFNRTSTAQAYINGEIQSGYSLDISGQQGSVNNSRSLTMGAYSVSDSHLTGKIDDVRMYNSAIPAFRIRERYYAGLNRLLANSNISKEEYGHRIK